MDARKSFVLVCVLACLLGGCYKDSFVDRSLIFATHTTLGLEASVQPTEAATTPVSLVLGYKRTEGVMNPVYHADGIETPDKETITTGGPGGATPQTIERQGRRPRYRDEAYSVLAKFRGDVGGNVQQSAEGQMSVAQWFATGEAAVILAQQPGISGAMSGSSRIAEVAVQERLARYATTDRDVRDRINTWIDDSANAKELQAWLKGRGVRLHPAIWVDDAKTSRADLQAAIDELNIP